MPAEHPAAQTSAYFANLVNIKSNNRISIKIYFNSQLGNPNEVIDQIQFAGIAISRVNISTLLEKVQSFASEFQELMYLSPDYIDTYFSTNEDRLIFACQTEKMTPLAVLKSDLRCFYSDTMPIKNFKDLENKRIGIEDNKLLHSAVSNTGAIPVNIISNDIYSSLTNGFINARESALCDFLFGNEYPFINYVLITPYISVPDIFIMSTEVLNDLSREDRFILFDCAKQASIYYNEFYQTYLENKISALEKIKTVEREY